MDMPDLLPNRINADAVVFLGCTMKELQWLVLATLFGSVILMGIVGEILLHMFMVGAALAFPTTVALTWVFAKTLQKLKQGRAKGYLKQRFLLWRENTLGIASPYVRREGYWSIERWL